MKKRHEELVHSEFEDWLKRQFPGQYIPWVEPPPTEPRPDWYIDINGTKYAIEATSVVPTAKQGRTSVLESSISPGIGEFIDGIQQKALAEGILNGAYAIALGPIPNNRALREKITSQVLKFIRTTRDQPKTGPNTIRNVGKYHITIKKFHMAGDYLAEIIDLGNRSEAEVIEDFQLQFRTVVERKVSLYKSFGTPVILLILDGFHIVDPIKWVIAASSIQDIYTFEAVFRIKPANQPLLLSTRSGTWLRP